MGRRRHTERLVMAGTEDVPGGARSPTVGVSTGPAEHERSAGVPGRCNSPREHKGLGPCGLPAGWGTDHIGIGRCRKHGGATYSHRKAAQRIMAEQMVATYGLPIEITPEDALTQELYRTAGHVAWLADQIREMSPDSLVWGIGEARSVLDLDEYESMAALREAGRTEEDAEKLYQLVMKAGISAWVELYLRERKHMTDLSLGMLKIGIEAKRVESIRRQGLQLSAVVRAFVSLLGLTPQQMLEVPGLLRTAVDQVMRAPAALDGTVVEPVDQAPEPA